MNNTTSGALDDTLCMQVVTEVEPSKEAALAQSILDLIGIINQTEETLATSRNTLLRRASTEPLTAPVASALALMALTGEEHARTARRRYRRLELALTHNHPQFDLANGLDWRRGGDAALKLALARKPASLDEAIDILTADELDSYSHLRRLTRKTSPKELRQSAAA